MPTVSIIVPVYNAQDYLGWCISSILAQTYKDIELILVNDGSVDASLDICNNYANIDKRVKIIDISNKGPSNARNVGIASASGEYIQFVDSDDYIDKNMTKILMENMQYYPDKVIITSTNHLTIKDNVIVEKELWSIGDISSKRVYSKNDFWKNLFRLSVETTLLESIWNKLYKREIINKNLVTFPLEYSLGEDFLFNLQYYSHCDGAVFLGEAPYYYIARSNTSLATKYRSDIVKIKFGIGMTLFDSVKAHHEISEIELDAFYKYLALMAVQIIRYVVNGEPDKNLAVATIAEILQKEYVQPAFKSKSFFCKACPNLIDMAERFDAGEIFMHFSVLNTTQEQPQQLVCIPEISNGKSSFANRFLVKCCKIVERVFKNKKLGKLAKIVELNLSTAGIKETIMRIARKIKHKKAS